MARAATLFGVSGIHAPVATNLILPGHLQRQDR